MRLSPKVVLAAGLFLAVPARADGVCPLKRLAALDAVEASHGRMLVRPTVDEQPTPFLVDTGSVISALTQPAVVQLQEPTRRIRSKFYMVSGQTLDRVVMVHDFALGDARAEVPRLLVMPVPAGPGPGFEGLLGADFLSRYDLEVDPLGHRVNLFLQDHCPGHVVYWTDAYVEAPLEVAWDHLVYLSMVLDGKSIRAMIDTGSGPTVLSLPAAERLYALGPESPGVEIRPRTDPSDLPDYRYPFKSLSIEGITIANPVIDMIPDKMAQQHDKAWFGSPHNVDETIALPDLILGMSVLSKLRFYIAYGEKKLYATAANAR